MKKPVLKNTEVKIMEETLKKLSDKFYHLGIKGSIFFPMEENFTETFDNMTLEMGKSKGTGDLTKPGLATVNLDNPFYAYVYTEYNHELDFRSLLDIMAKLLNKDTIEDEFTEIELELLKKRRCLLFGDQNLVLTIGRTEKSSIKGSSVLGGTLHG